MGNVLMDIQLDEPTIEYDLPVKKGEVNVEASTTIDEIIEQNREPFMVIDVPEPLIEMPKLKHEETMDLFELYLNYKEYLLSKYGEEWEYQLDQNEKSDLMRYYYDSHNEESISRYSR